ncbi:hypothetical protein ABE34_05180 [Lysinibacillus sphaericus]|nr:hypothetical protein [Lysinibacillus sphaericus]
MLQTTFFVEVSPVLNMMALPSLQLQDVSVAIAAVIPRNKFCLESTARRYIFLIIYKLAKLNIYMFGKKYIPKPLIINEV